VNRQLSPERPVLPNDAGLMRLRSGRADKEVNELRTNVGYIDTHFREPLVEENRFLDLRPDDSKPPSFDEAWERLPRPF
jgi:hypothetical protein